MVSKVALVAAASLSAVSAQDKNIVELAQSVDDLSTLVTAVIKADLVDALSTTQNLTVFAPVNAAFEALPDGILDNLLEPGNKDDLQNVLQYHVVPARAESGDLTDNQVLPTLQTKDQLTVDLSNGVKIEGAASNATVTTSDQEASNGVVHIVDTVLIPSNQPLMNIVEVAVDNKDLSVLVEAVGAAGLADALAAKGAITVFAPTDAAFAALEAGVVEDLLKEENKQDLIDILNYHLLGEKVYSTQLVEGKVRTQLKDADVTVSLTGGAKINDANVVDADVKATNGVVHVVDAVLLPPEKDNAAASAALSLGAACVGLAAFLGQAV